MSLTQKILLFVGAMIVALEAVTLAFTTVQADRLARATIDQGLQETREVWQAIQTDHVRRNERGPVIGSAVPDGEQFRRIFNRHGNPCHAVDAGQRRRFCRDCHLEGRDRFRGALHLDINAGRRIQHPAAQAIMVR